MSRLKLEMSISDAVLALSEGNPGAIKVLTDSIQRNHEIDPVNAYGPWGLVANLDFIEVYGSRIWVLYKDLCGEDLPRTTALVRAVQLGIISRETLDKAIDGGEKIDIEATIGMVLKEIPELRLS